MWEEGLKYYQQGEFQRAMVRFERLLENFGQYRLYTIYRDRCRDLSRWPVYLPGPHGCPGRRQDDGGGDPGALRYADRHPVRATAGSARLGRIALKNPFPD